MTHVLNWRHVATAVLILAALVLLFHILGAPIIIVDEGVRRVMGT